MWLAAMKSLEKHYRVDRRKIGFLKFILEACDGIAQLRTVDSDSGTVAIHVPPGCEADVDRVIESLKPEIRMEPAPRPGNERCRR